MVAAVAVLPNDEGGFSDSVTIKTVNKTGGGCKD